MCRTGTAYPVLCVSSYLFKLRYCLFLHTWIHCWRSEAIQFYYVRTRCARDFFYYLVSGGNQPPTNTKVFVGTPRPE